MIRKALILFLGVLSLSLSSCFDVFEDICLNPNGSGEYMLTYDLSALIGLMEDPSMKEVMQESLPQDGEDPDAWKLMDSTITLTAEELAASGNPEFWKNFSVHIKSDASQNLFKMEMKLDFASVKDIEYFYAHLSDLKSLEDMGSGLTGLLPNGALFSAGKGKLTRTDAPQDKQETNDEDMAMTEMLFGGSKFTTVYHLPGKVSRAKMPNAEVHENTVTVTNSLMDVLKGEAKFAGSIKYK